MERSGKRKTSDSDCQQNEPTENLLARPLFPPKDLDYKLHFEPISILF